MVQSRATTLDVSSNGNEGVLRNPQSSNITETSPSDCLVLGPGLYWGGSYTSAEVQSVYSTAPAELAIVFDRNKWSYLTQACLKCV